MKYLFLVLFIAVSYGGYRFYHQMQANQQAEMQNLSVRHLADIDGLIDRSEEIASEYESVINEQNALDAEYDAKMEASMETAGKRLSSLMRSFQPVTTGKIDASVKRRNEQIEKLEAAKSRIGQTRENYLTFKKTALAWIEHNNETAATKLKEIKAKLQTLANEGDSEYDIKSQTLALYANAIENSAHRYNTELRMTLDAKRRGFERYEIGLYRDIDAIEKRIDQLAVKTAPRIVTAQPMSEIEKIVGPLEKELQASRMKYTVETKKLGNLLSNHQFQIKANAAKLGKIDQEFHQEVEALGKSQETQLLFTGIILAVISIALLIATIFVFIGSKKVPEVEHTDYRA